MINEIPVRKYCKEFTKIENYGKANIGNLLMKREFGIEQLKISVPPN